MYTHTHTGTHIRIDTPTLCGATGSEHSVARLIIVIRRDERNDWGTPLTGILNQNIQLPLHFSYSLLSLHRDSQYIYISRGNAV